LGVHFAKEQHKQGISYLLPFPFLKHQILVFYFSKMSSSWTTREDTAQAAFEEYNLKKTESTETTPPEVTPTDINAACAKKKEVIQNLPTTCCRTDCGAPLMRENGSYLEGKDGCIRAYCKTEGGCGCSEDLFLMPELSAPIYEQVCFFEAENRWRADSPCKKCKKSYVVHTQGDSNGWGEVGHHAPIPLPDDWPTWDPAQKWWKNF
jgi:hypothetical protein